MKQLLIFILLCFSFAAGAQVNRQHRIDSLCNSLTCAGEDTGKVRLLLRTGAAFMNTDVVEMVRYTNQAMALAVSLGDKAGMAGAYRNMGIACSCQGKYNKALKNYRKGLMLDWELGDKQSEGGAFCNIGNVYSSVWYFKKALKNYDRAKTILEQIGDKAFLANTISGIGWVHIKKMQYTDAIDCFKQALELYKVIDNKGGMARACNELSWLYFQKKQYDKAADNATQALALARDAEYPYGVRAANIMLHKIQVINR